MSLRSALMVFVSLFMVALIANETAKANEPTSFAVQVFTLPKNVQFAVDFRQGAVYLPQSEQSLRRINIKQPATPNLLQKVMQAELGQDVDLSKATVELQRVASPSDIRFNLVDVQVASRQ